MSHTLLVADDAMIIRELIKDAAAEGGWNVIGEASNGQEAAEKFLALRPDAMTLDLVMPGSDGMSALRAIGEKVPDAKVLVISALDQKEVLEQAICLGASDFLIKPFVKERVIRALNLLVGEIHGPLSAE